MSKNTKNVVQNWKNDRFAQTRDKKSMYKNSTKIINIETRDKKSMYRNSIKMSKKTKFPFLAGRQNFFLQKVSESTRSQWDRLESAIFFVKKIPQIKKWVYKKSPNICVNKFMWLIRCTQITCDTFYPIEVVIATSENLQKCHKIQFLPFGKNCNIRPPRAWPRRVLGSFSCVHLLRALSI